VTPVIEHLRNQGAICEVLGPHGGKLDGGLDVDRALQTMASVLYDAVLVAGGHGSVESLRANGGAVRYVAEAYKHGKPVAAVGEGVELLREAPLNGARVSDNGLVAEAGVVTLASLNVGSGDVDEFSSALAEAIAAHRHFDREVAAVPA
jgi:catalase